MKKFFFFIFFISCTSLFSQSLLLEENFDFSGNLVDNGWTQHSGSSDIIATTTGLSFTNYASSGIGNAALVAGTSQDVNRGFDKQEGDGTSVYYSFMANFTSAGTGTYFFHIGYRASETSFSSFAARFFAKDSIGNLRLGISNSSTANYSQTDFSYATTYLIVAKYTINTAGADTAKLWVFPGAIPATEVDAGAPLIVSVTNGQDSINAVGIRQSNGGPNVVIDGIRISDSWLLAPLPVELTSFSAMNLTNGIKLSWTTASELNNSGFNIERSSNNISFNKIAFIPGHGTSTQTLNYSYVDNSTSGKMYYRLKQIDFDGSYSYSKAVEVSVTSTPSEFQLAQNYPNPFNPSTKIKFNIPEAGNVSLKVYNLLGQQVRTLLSGLMQAGTHTINFDASGLHSGLYFYKLEAAGFSQVKKMTLLK